MPPNCRCVKIKWLFKIKSSNVYWLCLVACEYIQILSVDFSKSYSQVVHKISFHILLWMVIHFRFLAKLIDVETAFLYGDLEEEIYMEYPQGISDIGGDDYII